MEIVEELCSFERRLAGTDAERRAANRLAEQLRKLGRRVEVEPTYAHPQIGLIYALHAAIAFAGSLVAVEIPALGFGLLLVAATSLYFDMNSRAYLLRRVFFRRASQNVVSPGNRRNAPARLVLTAHYDAARSGIVYGGFAARALTLARRILGVPVSPSRILFWSIAVLVPIVGLRMAEVDSGLVSVLQLLPTLAILIALFAAVDVALSKVSPGANDNASGVAAVLSLADELRREPAKNLDIWVVLTGGGESNLQGMHSFLRSHKDELSRERTYVLNIDSVGAGDVRFVTAEGPAVTYELTSRLTELAAAVAEADTEGRYRASGLRHGFATDALAARLRRIPATTITCLERGAVVPPRRHSLADVPAELDARALTAAHDFTLDLIRLLDRALARRASSEKRGERTAAAAR